MKDTIGSRLLFYFLVVLCHPVGVFVMIWLAIFE